MSQQNADSQSYSENQEGVDAQADLDESDEDESDGSQSASVDNYAANNNEGLDSNLGNQGAAVNNFVENEAENFIASNDQGLSNIPVVEDSLPVNSTPLNSGVIDPGVNPSASNAGNIGSPPTDSASLLNQSTSQGDASTNKVVDLGPPHGVVRWVGYHHRKQERLLDIQIITDGKPIYKIFQESNRANQPEIVVRFLNTELRHKVRRDIDASEFRSPVGYLRMRRDNVFRHTDVILTMRDAIQPRFFAKGSSVMLTFNIPERWYGPEGSGDAPVAKMEIMPDSNVMPVIAEGSDQVGANPSTSVAVYVDDPGRDTFGSSEDASGVPLRKVEGSSELIPQSQEMNESSDGQQSVPSGSTEIPAVAPPAASPSSDSSVPDKTEVRIKESSFGFSQVAQADMNYSSDIPPPAVNAASPIQGNPVNYTNVNSSIPQEAGISEVSSTDIIGVDQSSGVPASSSPKKAMKFDFRNATIGSVLRAISSESGLNFIMPPEVSTQKVTISLSNVSWDVALKAVLESNRLGMEEMGSRIIRIDTLKTFIDDRDAQDRARQATEALVPTKVLVMKLSYANAEEVAKMILAMLPKGGGDPAQRRNYERFKVQSDKRSNAVIVEATPTEIAKIKALVDRIDTRTPQVRIASRIVEVLETASKGLGITWGGPFNMDAGRGTGFGGLPFPNSLSSVYSVDPAFKESPVGAMSMKLGSINNSVALEMSLKALESKSQAESLQNQDLLIEDNEEATITAGKSDFFVIPGGSNGGGQLSEVRYDTKLKVRPHITADGAVQMKLDITGDSALETTNKAAEASKTTRALSTTLLRKSGDTAVIGGLYSIDKSKLVSGVPILSSIPILGALFRSTITKDAKRDLLIMVTPTIQSGVTNSEDSETAYEDQNAAPYASMQSNNSSLTNEDASQQSQGNSLGSLQQESNQSNALQQQSSANQQGQQMGEQEGESQQQGNSAEVSDDQINFE
jgi:type IV pilus secretin PilQ/predicted competence protein